jgi:signal transduction histidine kinase
MRRFFWLPLGLAGVVVFLALVALVAMSWRSLDRLRPVQEHLSNITRIQDVAFSMEQTLLKGLRGGRITHEELEKLRRKVVAIGSLEGTVHPDTLRRLDNVASRIAQSDENPVGILFETFSEIRAVLANEREQHDSLLLGVTRSTRLEFRLAVALLVLLPLAGAVGLLILQQRAEQPLKDLQDLLDRLAGRDFRPVPEETLAQTTKLAWPAFDSYNSLVSRLQDLEAEHQDRERLLEQRVREATQALLAQSRELSRAERLAAVGAVSAGLAHELRNPLAGIQLACSKLQQKLGDDPQSARIAAVITELKRINRLLSDQVDAARHAPEPSVPTNIATVVNELLGLLRYQVPEDFVLQSKVDENVYCVLPVAGLRQALLNLVLNAVQIQGDNGRVEVSAVRHDGEVSIRVDDDGPGFAEETLRAGIRPFATGRIGGTGLGLAMVRRFVRDLDGDLALENRSPRGAQVILRLPCRMPNDKGGAQHA